MMNNTCGIDVMMNDETYRQHEDVHGREDVTHGRCLESCLR